MTEAPRLPLQPYQAIAAGNFAQAETLAREAAHPAVMELAVAQYLQGNTEEANKTLEMAKRLHPAYFRKLAKDVTALAAELRQAMETGALVREKGSGGEDDERIRTIWRAAVRDFMNAGAQVKATSIVYRVIDEDIRGFVAKVKPDAVLEFGCACGYPLHQFALRDPAIEFVGFDRNPVLKNLNESHFRGPNLAFFDGDIADALPRFQPDRKRKMLMHVRAANIVYPALLERLYALAAENGFVSVVLYEIASLGGQSQTFRNQGSGFASEAHRSTMFLHDYATALKKAGFTDQRILRKPHGYALPKNNMLPGDTHVYIEARKPM